jgi:hypothetical protein
MADVERYRFPMGVNPWESSLGDWVAYHDYAALKTKLAQAEAERVRLQEALWQHRIDLHEYSRRPCETCAKSARALGIPHSEMSQRCMRMDENREAKEALAATEGDESE